MRVTLTIALVASAAASAASAATPSAWFPVAETAVYQTGDSWTDRGVTYRLYGVQACIRGTTVTNSHGLKRDCGEASLAMLIALTRDLRPQCYQAAAVAETKFVFCIASPKSGAGAGTRIDLGEALVSTGYAFASLRPDGKPIHMPYFVAQLVAQRSHAGLWVFQDVPEPNAIILRALNAQRPKTAQQGGAAAPAGRPN